MASKNENGLSLPVAMMLIMGFGAAVIVALCFAVVNYWPQPVSIAPYFGWKTALWWGLIVGGVTGLVLGFILDDGRFEKTSYDKYAK